MNRRLAFMSMIMISIVGVTPARGNVLFNTIGPGDSYNTGVGWIVSGPDSFLGQYASAQAFSPTFTGTLTEVRFAIGLDPSEGGLNSVTFNLMSDDNGTPGIVLDTYTFVDEMGFFGDNNPLLVASSLNQPLLVAGVRYWMVGVAVADTFAAWNWNDQGVSGTALFSDDGGSTWIQESDETLAAFQVRGTPIPEPSALTLLVLGAATLVGCRLRNTAR